MSDPAAPDAPAPPPPWRAALRLLGPLGWVVGWFLLVLALAAGGAVWLLRSEAGTQWLLARLPGIEATGWRGPLLGDRFAAERLVVRWSDGKASVTIDGVEAEGVVWHWRPSKDFWLAVEATKLAARRVAIDTGPSTPGLPTVPAAIDIPLRVDVRKVTTGELLIDDLPAFKGIAAQITIGDGPHRGYHARDLTLEWDRLHGQGEAELGGIGGLPLTVDLAVQPRHVAADAAPWTARVSTRGPLERFEVKAALRARAAGGRDAPSADLQATITPFAAWAVAALQARTQALDLSSLVGAAPQTRLDGRVDIASTAARAPVRASAVIDNRLPGRLNERRLPVRRMELELEGRFDRLDDVEIRQFDLTLGSTAGPAGRWQGRGRWKAHRLELDSAVQALRPQLLDGRAAAMTLGGPLKLALTGLPTPEGTLPADNVTLGAEVEARLEGRLDALPQPVQLNLEGSADARRIEVRRLVARSGSALAELQLRASRSTTSAPWQIASNGTLADFDPLPWWPGEAGSAWRQGGHRLSARWEFDLATPAHADRLAPLELAQRLAGTGKLEIRESRLAGVPLQADLTLSQSPADRETPNALSASLGLGGNRLTVQGKGNPAGGGASDQWQAELQAGALPALAPVARLHPALEGWLPQQGSAEGSATLRGRWPSFASQGRIAARRLQAGTLQFETLDAQWQFDTVSDRPLAVQAEATRLRLGAQRAERLRAEIQGTPSAHRLELRAAIPVAPPAVAGQFFGLEPGSGTRALLQGEGSWRRDGSGGGAWSGRIARLAAGAWDGRSLGSEVAGDWIEARDLRGEVRIGSRGDLERITAAAGSARLADTVTLRWDDVEAEFTGPRTRLSLRADIEPFAVAPLLARWQPTMGWNGDLQLKARVDVRAGARFDADIAVERHGGDLRISDDTGTQGLGLEELRLALSAQDGTWTIAQSLAGRQVGEAAGAVRIRTAAENRWPAADAPIEGVLQARVANLGIWGAWVPPGWRLAGELTTSAAIGGRFGAPEYTGVLRGTGIGVRNLLQGVNVTQGEVDVRLEGPTARIERFTARGGEGSLLLTGGATFGARPVASLALRADRFRLLGRIDRQLVVSGRSDLVLGGNDLRLDGSFSVDEGFFDFSRGDAPSLDDDVNVRRTGDAPRAPAAQAAGAPRRNVQMTVDVNLGEKLRLRGRGLETALRGQLRLTSPANRLAVHGTVTTEGGTYAAYGQKLEIERGIVAFSGPPDSPRLDILALRPNLDVRVGVSIAGNLQMPRVRLYADPEMGETDKLSWLVLGREPDGLGRTDTALLQRAAVALLAGEGEAPTDALMRAIGLDELSFRQSEGEVRETVIALGKQISRRWYVGYERGVNAATGTFQLVYRIAQRFTLRAQAGEDNSLDLIWIWRRDETPILPVTPAKAKPS